MAELVGLNKVHIGQLLDFLRFDRDKCTTIREDVKEQLREMMEVRIDDAKTYTGQELVDSLEDVASLLEGIIDRELEHQRDVMMVLIRSAFAQAKEKRKEISLSVSKLEDEKMVNACHTFCENLLKEPEKVMEEAPNPEEKPRNGENSSAKADDATQQLIEENQRLKDQIEAELKKFPQYQKTMELIHLREVEMRGLQARL